MGMKTNRERISRSLPVNNKIKRLLYLILSRTSFDLSFYSIDGLFKANPIKNFLALFIVF